MTLSINSRKKQPKKSFEELLNDLRTSNSEKVRYNAARILGEMGDSEAVEPLIDVLKNDKNGSVRLYAARALGELGDSKATEHLIESLREDRNVDVRVRAARALGRLGGKIVVEPLVEALNDENSQVCITATDALIEIGDFHIPALLLAEVGIHAEQVAGKKTGLIAAGAATDFHHGILRILRVGRDEQQADVVLHRGATVGGSGKLLLGHLSQLGVFLRFQKFLALGNGVQERLVFVVCLHHGLQVLVVLAEFDIAFHVRSNLRVVHLLLNLLIPRINCF